MAAAESRRIAVLLDHIESDYQEAVIAGAYRAAQPSRTRVLIIAGGWLGRPEDPVTRNFIYDYLRQARVDGLVVLGGSLANFCGVDRFRAWLEGFAHLPSVIIGLAVDNAPCVRADNERGVSSAISHLIEVHGRRRIACVQGPSGGPEADARFRAYRAALTEYGIRFDRRLVVQVRLGRDDGMAAVAVLLDERGFTPDTLNAMVGVNDDVARGALEALKQRSIAVPEQVAVVGFDNAASARSASPPLTTVDQGVEHQAFTATNQLLDALQAGQPPASAVLETTPVFRSSCGCTPPLQNDSSSVQMAAPTAEHTCRLALLQRRTVLAAELARAAGGQLVTAPGWELRVLDALVQDLAASDTCYTVHQFEWLARRHATSGGDIMVCQDVLTALRLEVLACAALEPATRPRLEDLFQEARLVLGRVGVDIEHSRQEILNLRVRIIAKECYTLLDEGTFANVATLLEDHLPALGIHGFLISRFSGPSDPAARLEVIARRSHGWRQVPSRFVTPQDLGLDATLEREGMLVLLPLESGSVPLGIAAFTWGAEMPAHYEQLREVLSAGLRAQQLAKSSGRDPATGRQP